MMYLDSSAIVKLISPEPETAPLMALLATEHQRISSALAYVEVLRVAQRSGELEVEDRARSVLSRLALVRIDQTVLRIAAQLGPPVLRTLDAIHLATAQSLPDPVETFVTYDQRQANAAEALGLTVATPC